MTTFHRMLRRSTMWDYIFGLIPEKRQPGTLSFLALLSVLLPILAAVFALAAWKLNDRLTRHRLTGLHPAHAVPEKEKFVSSPVPAVDTRSQDALIATKVELDHVNRELHDTKEELEQTKDRVQKVIAATERHVNPSQRKRFLRASIMRAKGPVGITAIEGDKESHAYAAQLRDMLIEAGYDVGEEIGTIQLRGDSLVGVRVGAFSKDTAPAHALPLSASFIDADIFAPAVINPRVPTGAVEVTVGSNPATAHDDIPRDPEPAASAPSAPSAPATAAPVPPFDLPVATPLPREKVVAPKPVRR